MREREGGGGGSITLLPACAGPPLSVLNTKSVVPPIDALASADVTLPTASSNAATIPATLRRCCPTPSFVSGMVSLNASM